MLFPILCISASNSPSLKFNSKRSYNGILAIVAKAACTALMILDWRIACWVVFNNDRVDPSLQHMVLRSVIILETKIDLYRLAYSVRSSPRLALRPVKAYFEVFQSELPLRKPLDMVSAAIKFKHLGLGVLPESDVIGLVLPKEHLVCFLVTLAGIEN